MIVEYIRYTIDADRATAFEAAYAAAFAPLTSSAHCHGVELARCADDPSSYVVRIIWDSAEGHMGGFRSSEAFRRFLPHIRPFIPDIQEMRHYEVVAAVAGPGILDPGRT